MKFDDDNLDLQESAIYRLLLPGKDNAVTARQIAILTGLGAKDGRIVRQIIERAMGRFPEPVAASQHGYFIVSSQDEVDEYAGHLTHRAIMDFNRRKVFLKKARENGYWIPHDHPEQLEIELELEKIMV